VNITVRCAGAPSSSNENEPHAFGTVASSTPFRISERALADPAAVDARLLVDDVGLERVTYGLVEQHAAHPRRQHDGGLTAAAGRRPAS
jgi:hypothetical protein